MKAFLAAFATLLVLLAAPLSTARADIHVDVSLGHGGRWIAGCTTPVSVTLRNDGRDAAAVSLTISQSKALGSPPMRHTRSVFVGPGATRREWFILPAPQAYASSLSLFVQTTPPLPVRHMGETNTRGRMTIDVQGPQPLARAELSSAGRIVGVVGDERNVLVSTLPQALSPSYEEWAAELDGIEAAPVALEALVSAPFSIEGFDALVLIDPSPDVLADPAALDGVLDWVALGGMLVVSPGDDVGSLGSSPLAPFLPRRAKRATERRSYERLLPILLQATGQKAKRDGLAFEGVWLPLVFEGEFVPYVDRPFGNGRIRLLAFDARAALRSATDHGHFEAVGSILSGRLAPIRTKEIAETASAFQFGGTTDVDEAVGKILSKDAFSAPPLILVLLALALYVLVVGPLDWIVLRRLGKQRLTTFTFGGAVLLFTAVAYGASFLVFASGAVVNRIVLVDLADGGRDGRQVVRVHDLVAYYSPRGADQELHYPLPTIVGGARLPGGGAVGSVGSALPVVVAGTETLDPTVSVQVAFRSQRSVRTVAQGPSGRTIEAEWIGDGARPQLRLVNGLPVDLAAVSVIMPGRDGMYAFGRIPAGQEETATWHVANAGFGSTWRDGGSLQKDPERNDVLDFLGFLSRTSTSGIDGMPLAPGVPQPLSLNRQVLFARTGIGRGDALRSGKALLLASANESPIALPGTADEGSTYVLIRMEIDLP